MPLTQKEQDELELLQLEEEEASATAKPATGAGFGALREAEASIPLPEPEPASAPRMLGMPSTFPVEPLSSDPVVREQQNKENVRAAATGARILPVVAAGLATGGVGAIPAAVAMGLAGGVGSVAGQGIEMAAGDRKEMSLPEAAGAAVRSAIPVMRVGGPAIRAGANMAAQAGANYVGKSIEEGRAPTARESIFEIATAIPSGLAGGISGMVDPVRKGSRGLQEAAKARAQIKADTGQDIAALVGERNQDTAILRGELRSMQSGETYPATPSISDLEASRRAVLLSAAKVGKSDPAISSDQIAQDAVTTLEQNFGPISEKSRASVAALAKDYESGKLGTLDDIQAELRALTPGASGETRYSVGDYIKQTAPQALAKWKTNIDALYAKVRGNPVFRDPTLVTKDNFQAWADETVPLAIRSNAAGGGAVESALPEGTVKRIRQLAESADTQSVEAIKNLRTEVMNGLNQDDYLPGLGARQKMRLASALSRDIDDSLKNASASNPKASALLGDLKAANKAYSDRIDDFDTVFAQGAIRETGVRGARNPEGIADTLTGSNAMSTIKSLRRIYGADADPVVDRVKNLIRDQIVDQADGSPAKLFDLIRDDKRIARELSAEVFPNAPAIEALAKRELAARGLPSTTEAVRQFMDGDPAFTASVTSAMTSTRSPGVTASAKTAIAAKAAEEAELQSTVLRSIRNGSAEEILKNPSKVVAGFLSGAYKPADIQRAVAVIQRDNPVAASNLQFQFVEDLLRHHSTGGVLNVEKLAESLAPATKASGGGSMTATAEAVLPRSSVDLLRSTANNISTAESARKAVELTMGKRAQTVRDIVMGGISGGVISASTALTLGGTPRSVALAAFLGAGGGSTARAGTVMSDRLRYSLAARILSDPRLSRIAGAAYDSQRMANAMRLAAHAIAIDSEDQKLVKEAGELDRKLSEQ